MVTETRVGPKRCNKASLAKVGVTFGEGYPYRLSFLCDECGNEWWPNLKSGGKLPRGYWKCPRGCNH
ncbi:MAG: hypothetical protein AMXMBFR7_26660 [Planctomycetota bacterium]